MTLSDFAAIGSLVSGFAVLVSLVYLSLQMKQTERNHQASIRASRASRIIDLFMGCTEPSVAEAVAKGMRGADDITDTEILQFANYGNARFFNAEDSFYQFREGVLTEFTFISVTQGLQTSLASPGMRAIYKRLRRMMGSEFVEFTDRIMSETPIEFDAGLSAQFRTDVAAERSATVS